MSHVPFKNKLAMTAYKFRIKKIEWLLGLQKIWLLRLPTGTRKDGQNGVHLRKVWNPEILSNWLKVYILYIITKVYIFMII